MDFCRLSKFCRHFCQNFLFAFFVSIFCAFSLAEDSVPSNTKLDSTFPIVDQDVHGAAGRSLADNVQKTDQVLLKPFSNSQKKLPPFLPEHLDFFPFIKQPEMLDPNMPESNEYDPYGPLVRCEFLPMEFLQCDEPIDHMGNETKYNEVGHGCYKYGGQRWEDVQHTATFCEPLPSIECYTERGKPRKFLRDGVPCLKYSGHYFLTTLLFSILLGLFGVDRFCLEYSGLGVVKLFSIGGFGVWWIVDIVLLITGHYGPADGYVPSN